LYRGVAYGYQRSDISYQEPGNSGAIAVSCNSQARFLIAYRHDPIPDI
jgi:hypothetical protein